MIKRSERVVNDSALVVDWCLGSKRSLDTGPVAVEHGRSQSLGQVVA
jgi:hypothetical protein